MIVMTLPNGQKALYVFRGRNSQRNLRNANYLLEAFGCLNAARNLRLTRSSWVRDAYATYGEKGPLTSGCEQTHFPDDVKDRLRTNAREIAKATDDARKLWQRSGKRQSSFLDILSLYRVDGSRY